MTHNLASVFHFITIVLIDLHRKHHRMSISMFHHPSIFFWLFILHSFCILPYTQQYTQHNACTESGELLSLYIYCCETAWSTDYQKKSKKMKNNNNNKSRSTIERQKIRWDERTQQPLRIVELKWASTGVLQTSSTY